MIEAKLIGGPYTRGMYVRGHVDADTGHELVDEAMADFAVDRGERFIYDGSITPRHEAVVELTMPTLTPKVLVLDDA